jgi:putative membrane protein
MVLMVLFWGGVILGIVWLIRGAFEGRPGKRKETPLEVLEHRFAEGAISVEDYRARREVLTNGTAGGRAEAPLNVPEAAGSS